MNIAHLSAAALKEGINQNSKRTAKKRREETWASHLEQWVQGATGGGEAESGEVVVLEGSPFPRLAAAQKKASSHRSLLINFESEVCFKFEGYSESSDSSRLGANKYNFTAAWFSIGCRHTSYFAESRLGSYGSQRSNLLPLLALFK
jgi:hypothetical protein